MKLPAPRVSRLAARIPVRRAAAYALVVRPPFHVLEIRGKPRVRSSGNRIATRESWTIQRPAHMAPLPYEATYSAAEYADICRGLIPETMEDKWFVFWENDVLYFHRSWTGHCGYRVTFERVDSDYRVMKAEVSDSQDFYRRGSDEDKIQLLDFLIRGLLLRQPVEFPLPSGLPTHGQLPAVYQHHVSGTAFPVRRVERQRREGGLSVTVRRWLRRLKE